jgi:hypothetical protein
MKSRAQNTILALGGFGALALLLSWSSIKAVQAEETSEETTEPEKTPEPILSLPDEPVLAPPVKEAPQVPPTPPPSQAVEAIKEGAKYLVGAVPQLLNAYLQRRQGEEAQPGRAPTVTAEEARLARREIENAINDVRAKNTSRIDKIRTDIQRLNDRLELQRRGRQRTEDELRKQLAELSKQAFRPVFGTGETLGLLKASDVGAKITKSRGSKISSGIEEFSIVQETAELEKLEKDDVILSSVAKHVDNMSTPESNISIPQDQGLIEVSESLLNITNALNYTVLTPNRHREAFNHELNTALMANYLEPEDVRYLQETRDQVLDEIDAVVNNFASEILMSIRNGNFSHADYVVIGESFSEKIRAVLVDYIQKVLAARNIDDIIKTGILKDFIDNLLKNSYMPDIIVILTRLEHNLLNLESTARALSTRENLMTYLDSFNRKLKREVERINTLNERSARDVRILEEYRAFTAFLNSDNLNERLQSILDLNRLQAAILEGIAVPEEIQEYNRLLETEDVAALYGAIRSYKIILIDDLFKISRR